MTSYVYTLTDEQRNDLLNQVKDVLLEHLYAEDRLNLKNTETIEDICMSYYITIKEPSKISAVFKKLFGEVTTNPHIVISKTSIATIFKNKGQDV